MVCLTSQLLRPTVIGTGLMVLDVMINGESEAAS
jgi:hypothetical protein